MNKTIMLTITILLISLSACTSSPTGKVTQTDDGLLYGYIGPLSGPAAVYGDMERKAIEMALEEINLQRPANEQIRIIYEDGKCDGEEAATAAHKLVDVDKVDAILGGFCSTETLAMFSVTEPNKIITFSSASSRTDLTENSEYFFRNIITDAYFGKKAGEYMNKKYDKIAIMTEQTTWGESLSKELNENFKGKILEIKYEIGTDNYRTEILKIKEYAPEAVFITSNNPKDAGLIIKEANKQDLKVQFIGTYIIAGKEAQKAAEFDLDGVIIIDSPNLENEKGKGFVSDFVVKYDEKPVHELLASLRYDSAHILTDSYDDCGQDNDCVKTYLENLRQYSGAGGTYSFTKEGNVEEINVVVKENFDGEYKVVGEI